MTLKPLNTLSLAIFVFAAATAAEASSWPYNYGLRISTLGGAFLAFEDPTTETNLLNLGNPAGLVFLPEVDQIDLGIFYGQQSSEESSGSYYANWTPTYEYYWEQWTTPMKVSCGGLFSPSGERSGLTYWLNDDWAVNVNLAPNYSGMSGQIQYENYYHSVTTIASNSTIPQTGSITGLGSSVKAAYLYHDILSIGGRFDYFFANSSNDVYPGNNVYRSLAHWQVGAGIRTGKELQTNIGLTVGNDDQEEDVISRYPDLNLEYQPRPFRLGVQAILGYLDYVSLGLNTYWKRTQTDVVVDGDRDSYSESDALGISPVVRSKIPLGYGTSILLALQYLYDDANTVMHDVSSRQQIVNQEVLTGLGFQFFDRLMQVGLQYSYKPSVAEHKDLYPFDSREGFNVGMEGWVSPFVALRLGYAYERAERITQNCILAGSSIKIAEGYEFEFMGTYQPKSEGDISSGDPFVGGRVHQKVSIGSNWTIYSAIHIPLGDQPAPVMAANPSITSAAPKIVPTASTTSFPVSGTVVQEYDIDLFAFSQEIPKPALLATLKQIAEKHAASGANVMIEALYQAGWKDAQQERLGNVVTYLEEQGVEKIGVQWVEKQDSQDTTRFRIKLY